MLFAYVAVKKRFAAVLGCCVLLFAWLDEIGCQGGLCGILRREKVRRETDENSVS